MIIPSYVNHESYVPIDKSNVMRVHDDRLVFRLKHKGEWTGATRTIILRGQWLVDDKLIKAACMDMNSFEFSQDRGYEWHGPFIDSDEDLKVSLPPWESFEDFKEVLSYLAIVRKPYWALVDTHAGIKEIKGKAKDAEEFKHLYLNIEERKRIIEMKAE